MPLQGVLAETTHGKASTYGDFYIAASYIKFIESAGGRVVPILYPYKQNHAFRDWS